MRQERWYRLALCCLISLGIHLVIAYRSPRLAQPAPVQKPVEIEVALDSLPALAQHRTPAVRHVRGVRAEGPGAKRIAQLRHDPVPGKAWYGLTAAAKAPRARGLKAGKKVIARYGDRSNGVNRPLGSAALGDALIRGMMHRLTLPDRARPPLLRTAAVTPQSPGGGSPSPSAIPDGQRGASGPKRQPEDVVFTGGGAGGIQLPPAPPQIGGGGGNALPSVNTPQAKEAIPEQRPGAGPGTGGGQGAGAGGGAGFEAGKGIGAQPDGKTPLATLQRKEGTGIGAGEGAQIGTHSPGGATGTGSDLPGTGGTGHGYGGGTGDGIGKGAGSAPEGPRGIPFGGMVGSATRGDPDGGGMGVAATPQSAATPVSPAGPAVQAPIHIVYLLDVSLSMKDRNKIGKAKAALKQALSELKPADSFAIITFCEDIHPYTAGLMPASPDNVQAASAYVDSIALGEGTNLSGGIEAAFALESMTDLMILSDGEPNRGICDFKRLLKMVQ